MMRVHSATVIRAILHQLCHSSVLEVSPKATYYPSYSSTKTGLEDEKGNLSFMPPHPLPLSTA